LNSLIPQIIVDMVLFYLSVISELKRCYIRFRESGNKK